MIEATIPATAKRPIKKDPAEDEVTAGLAWTGLFIFLVVLFTAVYLLSVDC
jgi:hypothetical protein